MSFSKYQAYLRSLPAERKEQKKILPYSVTPINDISSWRKEKELKEEAYKAKKAAQRQRVIDAMEDGSLIGKIFEESDTTKVMRRHLNSNAQKKAAASANQFGIDKALINAPYIAPWYSRLLNYVIETFTNLPFNQ